MDAIVRSLILSETKGKDQILAVPFMKRITFNLTCALLYGLHDDQTKEVLLKDFSEAFKGMWSFPLNLPGTAYRRALNARSRIDKYVLALLRSKRERLLEGSASVKDDVVCCLLALRDEHDELIDEQTIVDNFFSLTIASHDTSAILLSLMVWKLARDPMIYQKVLEEHLGIIRERSEGAQGKLTWSEVHKMKYTWRVAQELMRLIPPAFGNFRKALKSVKYGGYEIPEGWQVLWETSGTHHDKDIFEDPTSFDPSRFENPSKPIPPFAYIPFGAGQRMCIGNEFARVEALTVVHHLVTNFEWSQVYPDEPITRDPMAYPSKGLPIKLKPRKL
nr:cytochrome P450 [Paris polyphylla]